MPSIKTKGKKQTRSKNMAYISGAFDMGKAQTNASYAYTAWAKFNEEGVKNSLGITQDEFDALENQYRAVLGMWKQWAEEADSTEYDITDEAYYDDAHQQGVDRAEGDAGYDGNNLCHDTHGNALLSLGAGVTTLAGSGINAAIGGTTAGISSELFKTGSKTFLKAMGQGKSQVEAIVQSGKAQKAAEGSWMITAPLTFTVATLYTCTQPNRDAHEALMALKGIMDTTIPDELTTALNNLAEHEANVIAAREHAATTKDTFESLKEGTEGELEEKMVEVAEKHVELAEAQAEKAAIEAQIQAAQLIVQSIEIRIGSKEGITPTEQSQLDAAKANIEGLSSKIGALDSKIATLIEEINTGNAEITSLRELLKSEQAAGDEATAEDAAEVSEEQAGYDEQGKEIASKQGYLDEAASYDNKTFALCIVEAASQLANFASAFFAGVKAGIAVAASLGTNVWAWICTGLATAATVMSGIGVVQQSKWAVDIYNEIDSREAAQGKIDGALESYEYHIENWNTLNENTVVFNEVISRYEVDESELREAGEQE